MDSLRLGSHELRLGGVTHVMAVINLSPESHARGSVAHSTEEALRMASHHLRSGASIIDLGGQSSHHENPTLPWEQEAERLLPVVRRLADEGCVVSVDTWKPEVAEVCLAEGAVLVNDTGGLVDPAMRAVVGASGAAVVVVYVEGDHPHAVGRAEVVADKALLTAERLRARLADIAAMGITATIVDPGISINYRGDQSGVAAMHLEVLRGLAHLTALGRPVLVPIPRRGQDHRVAAFLTLALEHGADIVRVHDVEMASDLIDLTGRSPGRT